MLVGVLAIIVGVLIYSNWSYFIPVPGGNLGAFAIPARPVLPQSLDTTIFDRPDFPSAAPYNEVVTPSEKGVENPFTSQ